MRIPLSSVVRPGQKYRCANDEHIVVAYDGTILIEYEGPFIMGDIEPARDGYVGSRKRGRREYLNDK